MTDYKIQVYRSLRQNSIVHFDNGGDFNSGPNGHSTFEEIKIQYNGYSFQVLITDGYKDNVVGFMPTLKQAISLGKLQLDRCK